MLKNLNLRTKIVTSSLVPLILVIILSIVSWSGVGTLLQSSEWVTHTHEVMGQARLIEGAAVNMETGMRGYLLAGKEDFLQPYIDGKTRYEELTKKLKETVSDNPQQVQLLDEAHNTVKEWITNVVEPSIELRRKIGDAKTMDDLKAKMSGGKGKEYFDKTRELMAQFAAKENKLMEERKADALKATEENAKIEQTLAGAEKMVEHTYKVINKAKNIEALATDMETGLRGYLLTGKEEFLAPYNAGKQSFAEELKALSETVSDNSEQVTLLTEVQTNMNSWVTDIAVPGIEMRGKVGTELKMDDIASMEGLTKGKSYFDKFRSQMATFSERENRLMSQRQDQTNKLRDEKNANAELIKKTTGWVEHTGEVLERLKAVELSSVNMETGLRGYLLTGTDNYLEPYKNGKEAFESIITSLSEMVSDNPEQVSLLADIKSTMSKWQTDVADTEIALRTEIGNAETMNDIAKLVGQGKGKVYFDKFRGQIATFVEREASLLESRDKVASDTAKNVKLYIVAGTALTILLNIIISFFVSGGIARPITKVIEILNTIADQVSEAAAQVSSSSQSLASGVTEQAAGLEESSSSLEEISTVTQNSLGNARSASKLAEEAQISANDGLQAMEKMNTAIQDIHKSSDETAKIIKVIDEIAFQTNLLALNAAVEAARAGEAGKGFAVVAEEVRNLAMRSAEAAKDTSSMIDNSVANSNRGVEIANEVSSALNTIAQKISNTFDLVKNIATSSTEQAEGISQISKAVSQMDSITQSNSANAEESASAAEELYSQADQMKSTIFELNTIINGSSTVSTKISSSGGFDEVYHDIASGNMSKLGHEQATFAKK